MKSRGMSMLTALTILGLVVTSAAADEPASRCGLPDILSGFDVIKPVATTYVDAGGMSASTGELVTGGAAYLVTRIERPDGGIHPVFGADPRGMLLMRTTSGRFVVRILGLPDNHGWHGAY